MDLLLSYWPICVAGVGAVFWLARLEATSKSNSDDISDLYELRETDLTAAKEAREATNTKLDRMQDKMDRAFDEFRSDIKELLKRGVSR